MRGTNKGTFLPSEGRFQVFAAWLSWWVMLSSGGLVSVYFIGVILLYFVGGTELLSAVWTGKEEGNYLWVLIGSAFVGMPVGAWSGVWLWAKLMHKTRFICDERVKKMSGF